VTRNPELAARAKVMRLHGISRDAFDRFTAKTPSWYYEIIAPGFKYNLTDIAAALGLHQLKRAHVFQQRRAEIAAVYDEAFADLPVILPPGPLKGDLHAWHLYPLRLTDEAGIEREKVIERLFERGIGCSVHYIPLHLHPYWRECYQLQAGDFPQSQLAYERMFSLPIYTRMNDADVERVVTAVRDALRA
jgi:dTDP-4-amino-4,6-dideoxygalactose transaminase